MKTSNLKGHRVIVVGGSYGIGLKVGKNLIASGAEVVTVSRRDEELVAASKKLKNLATT